MKQTLRKFSPDFPQLGKIDPRFFATRKNSSQQEKFDVLLINTSVYISVDIHPVIKIV